MKLTESIIALVLVMAIGCQSRVPVLRDANGRIDLQTALVQRGDRRADQPGRELFIDEPEIGSRIGSSTALVRQLLPDGSIEESEVVDLYENGPLDDFSFADESNFRRVRLEDAIGMSLSNSPIIRDLGGLILRAPDTTVTQVDPALAYLDPRFGEEAALSTFDATYTSQILFQKNDNLFNNQFIGDEGAFQQDLARYSAGIFKTAATGGRFAFNNVIDYELNNSPSNRFNGDSDSSFAFDVVLEAEARQPLLQGAGTQFNRIAGLNNPPGIYNGVSIARTNTDIALADFETRIRDLISDVENAYWDLYFAYRDLEAKIDARDGAYEIWQNLEANRAEKSAAVIGQAKEQYYRFAAEVEEAIHGRLNDGTRTNNGSSSGTFRRVGGVRTAERRFRLITGMPLNDQQLVVPADSPSESLSTFQWATIRDSALRRRTELRRQRWRLKQRELELLASKNLLLPRFDLLARYRIQGFGHRLFGSGNELQLDADFATQLDSSALGGLFNNDLHEWEVGFDTSIPIGFRHQHAAVRHAELNLSREQIILAEQQRQIIFGLSNAVGELRRAGRVRTANQNRLDAAKEQFAAIQNIYNEQDTTIDLVLEAQRRVIEAKLQFFQSQVEYMLAVKAIHFEQGTLLRYHGVRFDEAEQAYQDAESLTATELLNGDPATASLDLPLPAQETVTREPASTETDVLHNVDEATNQAPIKINFGDRSPAGLPAAGASPKQADQSLTLTPPKGNRGVDFDTAPAQQDPARRGLGPTIKPNLFDNP